MGTIKELTAVFCTACVLSGGLRLLTGGALENSAKYILALILLAVTVTAVANTAFSLDFETEAAQTCADGYAGELSCFEAEYLCGRALEEYGVEYREIRAKATKTEDGGIVISEVEIYGADKGDQAERAVLETGITDTVKLK